MRVTYIGHATLLIEIGKQRLLTDPNFDDTLGRFLPRVSQPGIALADLPVLDAILLTHAHADHLSFRTLDRLPRDVPLFAPPAVATWLIQLGYAHARPLPADGQVTVGDVVVHAATARHQGSRYSVDRWRSAANMYLLDSGHESCFFAGDTALTADTDQLVRQVVHEYGRDLDIALLPLGMVEGILRLVPSARVGHIGLYRDHDTLEPVDYYFKVPSDASERDFFVLDPMLATGGSAVSAVSSLKRAGGLRIRFLCLVAAPEGVERLGAAHPDVPVYCAALDRELNAQGYILPGLGDAGDRLFGTR